jgi:hypothetical protein
VVRGVTGRVQGSEGCAVDLEGLAVDDRNEGGRLGCVAPRELKNLAAFLRKKENKTFYCSFKFKIRI